MEPNKSQRAKSASFPSESFTKEVLNKMLKSFKNEDVSDENDIKIGNIRFKLTRNFDHKGMRIWESVQPGQGLVAVRSSRTLLISTYNE